MLQAAQALTTLQDQQRAAKPHQASPHPLCKPRAPISKRDTLEIIPITTKKPSISTHKGTKARLIPPPSPHTIQGGLQRGVGTLNPKQPLPSPPRSTRTSVKAALM